jgi:hypothetical protein
MQCLLNNISIKQLYEFDCEKSIGGRAETRQEGPRALNLLFRENQSSHPEENAIFSIFLIPEGQKASLRAI